MNSIEAIKLLSISYHAHDETCLGAEFDDDRECTCGADEANARLHRVIEFIRDKYINPDTDGKVAKILDILEENERRRRDSIPMESFHNR